MAGAAGLTLSSALPLRSVAQTLPPPPTVEQWAKAPNLSHVQLSPDGTQIAYIRQDQGQKLLYHWDGRVKQFQTFNIGDSKIGVVWWIDNDHLVVTRSFALTNSATYGLRNNYYQATVYNLRSKSLVTLFDPNRAGGEGRWMGGLDRIQLNGKTHLITTCYVDEQMRLVRFPVDCENYDVIDFGGAEVSNWVVSSTGAPLGRAEYYVDKQIWVLNYFHNGHWKEIYRTQAEIDIPTLLGLGRDGQSLLVCLYSGKDDGRYYEIDSTGKISDPIPTPGTDCTALFDSLTFRFNGFASFDGWFQYHYFDPAMQDIVAKAQKSVEGYRMSISSQADDPRKVIVYSEGEDDAGTYYMIDFGAGTSITVGTEYPDIPPEWISAKKAITYKADDGLTIEAYLTLPPNREAKALPLIVFPHGGPFSRDDLSLDPQVQTFAAAGYAVLQPNFRGSDGYGFSFLKAGYGEWGKKMQTDLSDGVRELVRQGLADPKRVAIAGISYGGYAALAGATLDRGIYNCAIDISGVSDVTKWVELQRGFAVEVNSPSYKYMKRYLGGIDTDSISPVRFASKASIPIMIIHGRDDAQVPFYQSEDMVKALREANRDVTFLPLQHTDHNETDEADRITMMTNVMAFLAKHNPA